MRGHPGGCSAVAAAGVLGAEGRLVARAQGAFACFAPKETCPRI
jgi:hypothetical protein